MVRIKTSVYEMWMTHNGGSEKVQLPVHPEKITVTDGSKNQSVDIVGLGEITIIQDQPALKISFSSYFPAVECQAMQTSSLTAPDTLLNTIEKWRKTKKPMQFLITGTRINIFCTIEAFTWTEKGGDIGTIYYDITLKEYREVSVRQINVNEGVAVVETGSGDRLDNRVVPETYTVVKGDCLYNIAKKHLGDGGRYNEIYELNKDIIKAPNLIYPGQVLKMPAA